MHQTLSGINILGQGAMVEERIRKWEVIERDEKVSEFSVTYLKFLSVPCL